jgi:hypothetical protein
MANAEDLGAEMSAGAELSALFYASPCGKGYIVGESKNVRQTSVCRWFPTLVYGRKPRQTEVCRTFPAPFRTTLEFANSIKAVTNAALRQIDERRGIDVWPVHPKEAKGSSPTYQDTRESANMAIMRAVVSFQLHRIIMRAVNQKNILSNFA